MLLYHLKFSCQVNIITENKYTFSVSYVLNQHTTCTLLLEWSGVKNKNTFESHKIDYSHTFTFWKTKHLTFSFIKVLTVVFWFIFRYLKWCDNVLSTGVIIYTDLSLFLHFFEDTCESACMVLCEYSSCFLYSWERPQSLQGGGNRLICPELYVKIDCSTHRRNVGRPFSVGCSLIEIFLHWICISHHNVVH